MRDFRLFLEDIQEACEKIIRYTGGQSASQFAQDEKTFDAVVRNLAVIGEAVKNLPSEIREQYDHVQWRKIAGLRDIAIHEYFGLDEEILWDVCKNQIPALLDNIKKVLAEND